MQAGAGRMVLILDGHSELGAHVRSNLSYLPCLRHWIMSDFFSLQKDQISFMHAQHVLSYHLI